MNVAFGDCPVYLLISSMDDLIDIVMIWKLSLIDAGLSKLGLRSLFFFSLSGGYFSQLSRFSLQSQQTMSNHELRAWVTVKSGRGGQKTVEHIWYCARYCRVFRLIKTGSRVKTS